MSASLNKAMIIGNITKDIELKNTTNGQQVCSFGVATNRSWKNKDGEKQEEVEFHNVVAWGKLAEIIDRYLKKGSKVYISGRLKTREWEGKDGNKGRVTEIIAEDLVMLNSNKEGGYTRHDDMGGIVTKNDSSNDEVRIQDIPF